MRKNNIRKNIIWLLCILVISTSLIGCGDQSESGAIDVTKSVTEKNQTGSLDWFDSIPEYRGTPYIEVNHDIPFFTEDDKKNTDAFEIYSDLDSLGRCGVRSCQQKRVSLLLVL